MYFWRNIRILFIFSIIAYVKSNHLRKRDTDPSICDLMNNANKVQCFCARDSTPEHIIRTADCYLIADEVSENDPIWNKIGDLQNLTKLVFIDNKNKKIRYVPKVIQALKNLNKFAVRHGNMTKIQSMAFSNHSTLKEITLRENSITYLENYAFSNNDALTTIGLDGNIIQEINRNVFINLPVLEKLYLNNNRITTIHDKAFMHLMNLKELELDNNKIFTLNSDTFFGLENLLRLDLSSNSLEVIGDNTFLPLSNLLYLNLGKNLIQMLDEKAFYGLRQLKALSVDYNKITLIENSRIFEDLDNLILLNLKNNNLQELNPLVMAPILSHFYEETSSLDVDDNKFPCDCRLEWSILLMNKTKNNSLRNHLNNMKCFPDEKLLEIYNKTLIEESVVEDGETSLNDNIEYYDDKDLNGKLFYTDVRDLLNCTSKTSYPIQPIELVQESKNKITIPNNVHNSTSRFYSLATDSVHVSNQDVLDLSLVETTPLPKLSSFQNRTSYTHTGMSITQNEIREEKKSNGYTTTRLATVSAKPDNKGYEDHEMASDEAKPENYKTHRSIKDDLNDHDHNRGFRQLIPAIMYISVLFHLI